jgi:hypothetical protein
VQSIPPGEKVQVSTSGGTEPAWRNDGKELYYRNERKFMAVTLELGLRVELGRARELFTDTGLLGYAVSPDGERFLLNNPVDRKGVTASPLTVVLGFTAGLRD